MSVLRKVPDEPQGGYTYNVTHGKAGLQEILTGHYLEVHFYPASNPLQPSLATISYGWGSQYTELALTLKPSDPDDHTEPLRKMQALVRDLEVTLVGSGEWFWRTPRYEVVVQHDPTLEDDPQLEEISTYLTQLHIPFRAIPADSFSVWHSRERIPGSLEEIRAYLQEVAEGSCYRLPQIRD